MQKHNSILIGFLMYAAALVQASAQESEPVADASQVPVRAAAAQPAVGEEVVGENQSVDSTFFEETRICSVRGCRSFIFDKRSGALICNDGIWSEAYAQTGRGGQVIRVKAFTDDEMPKPAPSDAPLEYAPAITEVLRH